MPCAIYNYKNGKNYLGPDSLAKEEITYWHIGGFDEAVVPAIKELLGAK